MRNTGGSRKKVLIMAGGTGGHVFPALCIANRLREQGLSVEWLGTRNGLEATVIPNARIPIHYISVSGLRGGGVAKKLLAPFTVLLAIVQALGKLLKIRPHCVLGMGGFVTGPGGIAAWMLRKTLLIHEQNSIAGFTNQMLCPFAAMVMEAFPGAFLRKQEITVNPLLKALVKEGRAIHVGNPVRADILSLQPPEQRMEGRQGSLRILVLGGSLGAVAINRLVPETLSLMEADQRPDVIHQCGRRNLEQTQAEYRRFGLANDGSLQVVKFIDDMAQAYAWADLVICRSGALTVAELSDIGIASVLIPYPHAVDDHQTANARYLADAGAAYLIQQVELKAERLLQIISKFQNDRQSLLEFAKAARSLAQPRATELASTLCVEACYA